MEKCTKGGDGMEVLVTKCFRNREVTTLTSLSSCSYLKVGRMSMVPCDSKGKNGPSQPSIIGPGEFWTFLYLPIGRHPMENAGEGGGESLTLTGAMYGSTRPP